MLRCVGEPNLRLPHVLSRALDVGAENVHHGTLRTKRPGCSQSLLALVGSRAEDGRVHALHKSTLLELQVHPRPETRSTLQFAKKKKWVQPAAHRELACGVPVREGVHLGRGLIKLEMGRNSLLRNQHEVESPTADIVW